MRSHTGCVFPGSPCFSVHRVSRFTVFPCSSCFPVHRYTASINIERVHSERQGLTCIVRIDYRLFVNLVALMIDLLPE